MMIKKKEEDVLNQSPLPHNYAGYLASCTDRPHADRFMMSPLACIQTIKRVFTDARIVGTLMMGSLARFPMD